ncbi:DciA family protein [Roseicyclus sp. F158]|uniref:DciA family protein n=1 Tax=Tropicimonas omnivorans TaxID=3075590 RepID=A0ABU3DDN1_9RHOB|nr:DciA family protein [Roseicyclus sp. F158]MDT0681833.1 DciA family protein [Roseicyclus sp. F158]
MAPKDPKTTQPRRRGKFRQASSLVASDVRRAGESRGFANTRLLTHWPEIAGAEIAAIARPVSVDYGRGQLGATLTLLTTGAQAPLLQMQEPRLREKINACYGYAAIKRIRITQTAPTGFAEGRPDFAPQRPKQAPRPDPATLQAAEAAASGTKDEGLKAALAMLGANVLGQTKHQRRPQ